ncbi:conserved phage C-terminal domain-containing protein [Enterobacter cancerogenus]|nr:conserved phage C-terminal domain-containing protein [Enterobacter cancerogenus]
MDRRTAMRHVDKLCACGFLQKELRKGVKGNTSNAYRLTPDNGSSEMLKNLKSAKKLIQVGSVTETPPPGVTKSPGLVSQDHPGSVTETPPPGVTESLRTSHSFEPVIEPVIKKTSCPVRTEPDENSDDPAQRVLAHFNQVTKSSYRESKTTMGYIRGRLSEPEYVAEDLILVTDYATAKWLNDAKMCDYLRPKTLFGPENFQEYHQKALKWNEAGRPECINGLWLKDGSNSGKQRDVNQISKPDRVIPPGFRG